MLRPLVLFVLFAAASSKVYFQESFGDGWEDRWVVSKAKGDDVGKFVLSAGDHFGDEEAEKGIQTSEDAKFYQISAAFDEFSNEGKDLVIQYRVKHNQRLDCGGAYLKIGPAGLDQDDFNGDTAYNIMFGPDICGSTKRTHVIFRNGEENHLVSKDIRPETNSLSHLYTLIVRPDNTFEVRHDGKEVRTGSLKDDFGILEPREIPDPEATKPEDWGDDAQIPDPEDEKPEGYDDIPAEIPDPDAEKPEDWDDELDGEWEAPMIDNPDYEGPWEPRMIPNPDYEGPWEHPKIANPDFVDDDTLYSYESFGFVGIEIWQVKSGSIFDDILITDSIEEAEEAIEAFKELAEAEQAAKNKADEEARAELEALEEEDEDEEEYEDEDEEAGDYKEEL